MPHRVLFREHLDTMTCEICGAYVAKERKHRKWHRKQEKKRKGGTT